MVEQKGTVFIALGTQAIAVDPRTHNGDDDNDRDRADVDPKLNVRRFHNQVEVLSKWWAAFGRCLASLMLA